MIKWMKKPKKHEGVSADKLINSYIDRIKPICFICQKDVEQFEVHEDFMRYAKIFVAKCHEETQTFWVGNEYVQDIMNNPGLQRGYAFVPNTNSVQIGNKVVFETSGVDSETRFT